MRSRFRPSPAMIVACIALFVALGGTATAVTYVISSNSQVGPGTISGHEPPTGDHSNIVGGSINATDLANSAVPVSKLAANSVGTGKVIDNSLTGADVNESSLGQVPNALLGGYGRWVGGGSCNPPPGLVNPGPYVNCATVTVSLPAPARFLLLGQATGVPEDGQGQLGLGNCRLGSTSGPFLDSTTSVDTTTKETVSPVAVSGVFQPGQQTLDIECNDAGAPVVGGGEIRYQEAGIVAVAIAPD